MMQSEDSRITKTRRSYTEAFREEAVRLVRESGHPVAQNINLVSTALGYGSVNIGGFFDREIDEFLAPIPYIVPGQLFAALLAEAKGLNPDAPRSLSKVTRTL